ncbi:MAG: major capsid protein [Thermodesulfobacteriota bacterium]
MAETITGTLRDLASAYAKKQPKQVEHLLEDTNVLDTVKFEPASHTLWNVYDEVTEVSGGGFVDMDAPLGDMEVNTELKRVDLSILGGKIFCPEDKALAYGGRESYFTKKTPKILRKLGVDAEKAVIYDNLRPFALDSGNALDAGAAGDANFCILAVRWVEGETIGLYSVDTFKRGALFNVTMLHNGALYEHPTSGVLGYGMRYKGYFGMQLANPKTVAGIFNVTPDHKPTSLMVDNMLDMVRAGQGTYIYCHRKALSILADVGKGAAFQMGPGDGKVDRRIAEWNGVPIITSYNFVDGAEARVAIA